MCREKWIGLAEVEPTFECQDLDQAAFVNVIGLALDEDSFIDQIRLECERIDCRLLSVEDVEQWEVRIARYRSDTEVIRDAGLVSDTRPFVFGTFVCYPDEDVEE
jgi:hypothetical protein